MTYHIFGYEVELAETRIAESQSTVREQLAAYERGDRRRFDLEITLPEGFTGEVHTALRAIPYGETRTYGQIAEQVGTAPIAVGQACARNPLPLVVPCHRVVGSDSLRGYMYPGLQERLLELERAHVVE